MRLAFVNQDPGIAPQRQKGAAVHVAALQHALRGLGCDLAPVEAKDDTSVALELARLHGARALDLVYERHALGATGAARFCLRSNVPLFLEVNAPLLDEAREQRGLSRSDEYACAEALVLRAAAHLFPVSTAVAAYLERRGVEPERLHVTPNGVDSERFRPSSERPLALPVSAFVLGFHGRLRPWHNFGLFARAFEVLVERGYPVHLLAIGVGEFAAHLSPRLRARATLLEWMPQERLAPHVACFDALPLTYAPEASCYFSPLKLLEAMACGAVPIVPRLGDLVEAVDDGRCGLVVAPGDARALADAVATLVEQPELRGQLSRAAIERARSRSWNSVAAEVLSHVHGARVR